jgi:hypothetical protein
MSWTMVKLMELEMGVGVLWWRQNSPSKLSNGDGGTSGIVSGVLVAEGLGCGG